MMGSGMSEFQNTTPDPSDVVRVVLTEAQRGTWNEMARINATFPETDGYWAKKSARFGSTHSADPSKQGIQTSQSSQYLAVSRIGTRLSQRAMRAKAARCSAYRAGGGGSFSTT